MRSLGVIDWKRRHLVLTIGPLFLLIVAVLFDLAYLYLMAASLYVLPFVSCFLAQRLNPRFEVRREHAQTAAEGRLLPITLTVTAAQGLPQASLLVADVVPPEIAGPEAGRDIAPLDHWDGQTGSRTYLVEPTKRGVYRLGPTRVMTTDPLGMTAFVVAVPATTEIVIHPTPVPVPGRAEGGEGAWGAREREGRVQRGEGMDFHGVREWRPGDPLRRVHWATTARSGQLAVVEFEQAFQQDIVIGLDLSRGTEHGTGRETTLEYAVKAAATLADQVFAAGGGVTLVTQAGRVEARRTGGGAQGADRTVARFRLFDHLARARAEADHSLAQSLRAARETGSGGQIAVLTAGGDPLLTTYLSECAAQGDHVRIFFFEPSSFGGPAVVSPAITGGTLHVVRRENSPWHEGGKAFAYLLRESA